MIEQKSFSNNATTLYVVSTPIGNLKDITLRAIDVLSSVDIILAEDTRVSGVLLKHHKISTKMISYHEFNKEYMEERVIGFLEKGKNIALISDAGTPGISDPGYEIIKKAIENGYNVVSIPGASSILTALVTTGLIIQPFTFIGFLPRKNKEFNEMLEKYKLREETLVIFESPNRIKETLKKILNVFGNRNIALLRELTKMHETIIRTTLEESTSMPITEKGEFVLVVEGHKKSHSGFAISIDEHVVLYLKQGLSKMDAIKNVAKDRGVTKSSIYERISKK